MNRNGGIINAIISLMSLSIFTYNLLDQITKGQNILSRLHYTLPFLILSIIGLFVNYKVYIEISFLVVAIGLVLTRENMGTITPMIFFVPSYHIIRTQKNLAIIIFFIITSIFLKATIYNASMPNALGLIVSYISILLIYTWIFSPKRLPILSDEESKMLELLSKGDSQKTAGAKLGMDKSQANYCVKNIRTKCDCNTIYEVLYLYGRANS